MQATNTKKVTPSNAVTSTVQPEGYTPADEFQDIVETFLYSGLGLFIFAFTFWLIVKISPFSIRREIEEDQNTSLAIIIGSVMIGLSVIIAAAIH